MTSKNTDTYKISVINRQTSDGMSDTVTESGAGTYRKKDNTAYISYSSQDTKVFIKAESGIITVKRTGQSASDMRYEMGKHTSFDYRTPYGTITMSVFTESIICRTHESGGEISLSYIFETSGDKLKNNMIIKIER